VPDGLAGGLPDGSCGTAHLTSLHG
jgi:hypothetical protein